MESFRPFGSLFKIEHHPVRPTRGEASSSGGSKATSASRAWPFSSEEVRIERSPRAFRAIPANTYAMIQQMDHTTKPKRFPASKPAKSENAYEMNGHLRGPPAESTAPTETETGQKKRL